MIYRNVVVAIPEGAYVSKDKSVFVKDKNEYDPEVQYSRVKHTIIGRCFRDGMMYPNTNYRLRYPDSFNKASPENIPVQSLSIGLYIVLLAIAESNGLYRCLYESFGIEVAVLPTTGYQLNRET